MAKFAKDLNLKETELRLGLPGTEEIKKGIKRIYSEISEDCESRNMDDIDNQRESTPTSKVQIVGWPPIRSYRKNTIEMKKKIDVEKSGIYVKVSMDGAPYLRKIDMKVYKGYSDLLNALINMFKCFSKGGISEREGFCHAFEYELTYEDKDGDWMLAGDVPWSMFVSSCKRLRIMKRKEARGMNSES